MWKCVCGKEMRLIEVVDEAVWVVVIKPRWDYQEKKMNDQPDLDEHLRREAPVELGELRMARKWVDRKLRRLANELYAVQEGQWSVEDRVFFIMMKGPTMNDPNRGRENARVCLDDGAEIGPAPFEAAMGPVQLADVLGERVGDRTMEERLEAARQLFRGGDWMFFFNGLGVDNLVADNREVQEYFCQWAARNHLHRAWRIKLVPREMLEEAMNAPGAPFSRKVAMLISYMPRFFRDGNQFWMSRRVVFHLTQRYPELEERLEALEEELLRGAANALPAAAPGGRGGGGE